MVSIDDVARSAGVSTATVSRALSGRGYVSDATRARVVKAAQGLGYVVSSSASSLASGRTRNIGVLVPYLDRWFFSTVLSGIASELLHRGYDLTLYNLTADADERRSLFETFLHRQRVDGVIAIAIELGADEVERLVELDLPVLAVGDPSPGLTPLAVDDLAVARLATEHLLSLGHRAIAHIGAGPRVAADLRTPSRRRLGFIETMTDAGIPADGLRYEHGDFTLEGGHHAARRLLQAPDRPTAVFAASDEMAIGALLAARELGIRVPEDFSVIGVDGHELGAFFDLTTVDQFPRQQGERAAAAILAAVDRADAELPAREQLPFELVVRGTTAPPPGCGP